jgi:hypothetical protein
MSRLHKTTENDTHFVPKEGQRDFLCSNKKSFRCPSLGYMQTESSEFKEKIDKAFDILFESILQDRKNLYDTNKINSNICQSINLQPRE